MKRFANHADMFEDEYLRRLFPRSTDIDRTGSGPHRKLLQNAKDYAPVGIDLDPPAELTEQFKLAKDAAAKFQAAGYASLSVDEQQALNAYAHLVTRPSLPTEAGKVRRIPDSWPLLEKARAVVDELLKGVGRLDRVEDATRHRVATGWFVAKDVALTNNHVVAGLCGIDPHQHPGTWQQELEAVIDQFNARWRDDPGRVPASGSGRPADHRDRERRRPSRSCRPSPDPRHGGVDNSRGLGEQQPGDSVVESGAAAAAALRLHLRIPGGPGRRLPPSRPG